MNNINVDNLRAVVKNLLKENRFIHTLGVEKEAYKLGQIFIPDKCEKLAITGLLHDITKNFSLEQQLELCDKYQIKVDRNNISFKLLHAKTGAEFAREQFGECLVDEEIYNGIYFHTTGREKMTLFEAIIYLADYIEENRTFEDCVFLREYFYKSLEKAKNMKEKKEILRNTMILSFDLTIKNLISENKTIDFDTIKARNYFIDNFESF